MTLGEIQKAISSLSERITVDPYQYEVLEIEEIAEALELLVQSIDDGSTEKILSAMRDTMSIDV